MSDSNVLASHRLVPGDGEYPFVAERIAIDVTNALRGASAGLRGFRSRSLLGRVWDGVTGAGQEMQAAIGEDLVTVQRGMLRLVRELMTEEARTQECVHRVLVNLHAVNRDLDDAVARLSALERKLDEEARRLRQELKAHVGRLEEQIREVRGLVDREAETRRVTELYRAGRLHPHTGPALCAALYVATIHGMYAADTVARQRNEQASALAVVEQVLDSRPDSLRDSLVGVVHAIGEPALPLALYLTERSARPFPICMGRLLERRIAGLEAGQKEAEEAIAVVRYLRDPDGRLRSELVRPTELVRLLAEDLIADAAEDSGS